MEEEILLERQHEEEAVLGDGRVVDAGGEQERDPLGRAGGDVDLVDADPVLREHFEPRRGLLDHGAGDRVVATEVAVDLADERKGVGFGERSAGGDNLPAGGSKRRVVGAGGVLEGGRGEKDSRSHRGVLG